MVNIYQKTSSEIDRIVAQNIVKLRKRKKLSPKELSKRSGVSYGSLRRFETEGITKDYTRYLIF